MRKITAYQCEHCEKKIYRDKWSAIAHEKKCYWNPDLRACASCHHNDADSRQCMAMYYDLSDKNNLQRNCEVWRQRQDEY